MTLRIATTHTKRRCRYCKHNLFIGCGFYSLGHSKYICEGCVNLAVAYLILISEKVLSQEINTYDEMNRDFSDYELFEE